MTSQDGNQELLSPTISTAGDQSAAGMMELKTEQSDFDQDEVESILSRPGPASGNGQQPMSTASEYFHLVTSGDSDSPIIDSVIQQQPNHNNNSNYQTMLQDGCSSLSGLSANMIVGEIKEEDLLEDGLNMSTCDVVVTMMNASTSAATITTPASTSSTSTQPPSQQQKPSSAATSLQPTRKSTRLSSKPVKTRYTDDLPEDLLDEEEDDEESEDNNDHLNGDVIDLDDEDEEEDDDVEILEDDDDEERPLKKRKLAYTSTSSTNKTDHSLTKQKTPRKNNVVNSKLKKLQDRLKVFNLQERLKGYRCERKNTNQLLETLLAINNLLLCRVFTDQRPAAERANQELSLASLPLPMLPKNDPITADLTFLVEKYRALVEKKIKDDAIFEVDAAAEAAAEAAEVEEAIRLANARTLARQKTNASMALAKLEKELSEKQKSRGRRKAAGFTKVILPPVTPPPKKKRKRPKPSVPKISPEDELTIFGEFGEAVTAEQYTSADGYTHCPWADCTYESKRIWALKEHINITHTGKKTFACPVEACGATFFGSNELDKHMKGEHAEEASLHFTPCTWPGCNALFKSKLGLRAHLQVHRGENLIPCDWPGCNYAAKNKRQAENHTRKHTGDRPYNCDIPGCPAKFRTNDSLRHHKKSHSDYRPFKCDWPGCEAHFKTNRGLIIHRALHTGEKLFKCEYENCDFSSERKYHIDVHVYQVHTHTKPYPCTWAGCDAGFLRNDKLQNHLKIHRQEKPFKCIHPSCDKHFVEKGNMMKHYNNVHKR